MPPKAKQGSVKSSSAPKQSTGSNSKQKPAPVQKSSNVTVSKKEPVIQGATSSKTKATVKISQTTVTKDEHNRVQRTQVESKVNHVVVPMKPREDLKPDSRAHELEKKFDEFQKHDQKYVALHELHAAIPLANMAFSNLKGPCQKFIDAANAIDDFTRSKSVGSVIEESLKGHISDVVGGLINLKGVTEGALAGKNFIQTGFEFATPLIIGKLYNLLDNLAAYVAESLELKSNLRTAYEELVRAADKFNLRNSELFDLIEKIGGKTSGKEIIYPVDFNQLKKTFSIRFS